MSGIERQDWECSEWQSLTGGQQAIYMAFCAPKVNNIPQMPEENNVVIAGEDYTPEDKDLVVFINGDGSLNETPDPNEIIKYTPQQQDAIKLWLTEEYVEGPHSDDESENEWIGSASECEDWDEEYESDDGWSQMDDEW